MKNKALFIIPLLSFLLLVGCAQRQLTQQEINDLITKSKSIGKEFSSELKGELQNALMTAGPGKAIGVCKNVSKEAEETYTSKYPEIKQLRRISLKTRNPRRHTPTRDEAQWLKQSEAMINDNQSLQPGVITSRSDVTVLLPIVIDDPTCLMCHGKEEGIVDEIKTALSQHYPEDQARGYEMGAMRGALAIEWKK